MKKILLPIIASLLMLASCSSDVVNEYSTHQCYYIMDFSTGHTTSYLYGAVQSTNYFCMASFTNTTASTTGPYKLVTKAYGATDDEEMVTEAILTQPSRKMGLNNGIIVGRSSFQDGALYVFDRQCPNCYNNYRRTNYPLSFKDAQNAYCSTCKRTYGLLNGGVVVDGENGEKLFRYHATYVGTRLTINNPQ